MSAHSGYSRSSFFDLTMPSELSVRERNQLNKTMWKEEFYNSYFDVQLDLDKVERAQEIKSNNLPKAIFKYRSINKYDYV